MTTTWSMTSPPDPLRVLAHAEQVGDDRLADVLRQRLGLMPPAAIRVVERLCRALGL